MLLVVPVTAVVFVLILARVSDLMVDVAEHKRVQDQLQSLALIVESTDDAVVGWSPNGTISSWNTGAANLFGYRSDEIFGAPLAVIGPPGRSDATEAVMRRILNGEPVETFESECRRKDGSIVDVSITMSTIRDFAGAIIGGAAIGRDITIAKHIQVELAEARDRALHASRLKSEFLATMSHEIRTPMNGVIGLTALLLNTSLDDRQRQFANGVSSAGETLLTLINDILDFSKIEAGKLTLESSDFDLEKLINDVATLAASTAQAKGLELAVWCDPSLPGLVRGDIGRVRQVLNNLVGNAVKFTEHGEVVLRVTRTSIAAGSVGVRFDVTDTGIGIDPEVRPRLFEPFSQADASTTRRYGGTGLGLAISTHLVQAMGGTIDLVSRPDEGSTFSVQISFQAASGTANRPVRYPAGLLEGVKVLIVDDNATNRLILHEQLVSWAMKPTSVADGPSALACLRAAAHNNEPYTVALLDMCMADMDGLELARQISADSELTATRTVLLSSAGYIETEQASQAGLVQVLSKPVRQSHLHGILMGLLAGSLPALPVPIRPVTERAGARGHVLVVEDNPTNQMVALGILAQLGWTADIVADGLAAIDAVTATMYDAVLMDCQMPRMDGYTATALIRRAEGPGKRLPVIAMTASAIEGDRERCIAAGMDDYVPKPVSPEEIDTALNHWTTNRQNATYSPTPVRNGRDAAPQPHESVEPLGNISINVGRLETLRNIGEPPGDLLTRMIGAFVGEFPDSLASLNAAASVNDLVVLGQVAHRLKGAASNLGVVTMASHCTDLERTSALSDRSSDLTLIDQIAADFDLVQATLNANCNTVSS